jgi:hypothetical protein
VDLIPASREEVQGLLGAVRPLEKSLLTGIAEYHLGGAVYETMDGEKPDAKTCKEAAAHFARASAEFKQTLKGVQAIIVAAKKMKGNKAFITRMDDLVKILERLEKHTSAMAKDTGSGELAQAEDCYAAASDLARLSFRIQENAHAYRLKMAGKAARK